MFITQKLDVSHLENHMQTQFKTSFLEDFRGFHLFGTQLWDDTFLHESIEGFDVIGIPFRVHSRARTGFEVEDGGFDVGFLAGGFFAFAVKVPDGFGEGLGYVGTFALEGVPDVVRGDDVGFSAFEGAGDAEETDDVGVVGVEKLTGVGAVDSYSVDLWNIWLVEVQCGSCKTSLILLIWYSIYAESLPELDHLQRP
jgi:hypothetical protein